MSIAARSDLYWGFIHHNILHLTESKHSGGAQGTFWCDGCRTVTVFPTIHHLFQVTLIKKTSPGMTFGKPEPLTYSTYQIHLHFGKWAFSSQSSKNDDSNWTAFFYYFSRSLYSLLKVYDLSTHLLGNTIQIIPNIAITTCSNWKEKKNTNICLDIWQQFI